MSSFCLIWRFIISYYPPVQDCTKGDMGSNKEQSFGKKTEKTFPEGRSCLSPLTSSSPLDQTQMFYCPLLLSDADRILPITYSQPLDFFYPLTVQHPLFQDDQGSKVCFVPNLSFCIPEDIITRQKYVGICYSFEHPVCN